LSSRTSRDKRDDRERKGGNAVPGSLREQGSARDKDESGNNERAEREEDSRSRFVMLSARAAHSFKELHAFRNAANIFVREPKPIAMRLVRGLRNSKRIGRRFANRHIRFSNLVRQPRYPDQCWPAKFNGFARAHSSRRRDVAIDTNPIALGFINSVSCVSASCSENPSRD